MSVGKRIGGRTCSLKVNIRLLCSVLMFWVEFFAVVLINYIDFYPNSVLQPSLFNSPSSSFYLSVWIYFILQFFFFPVGMEVYWSLWSPSLTWTHGFSGDCPWKTLESNGLRPQALEPEFGCKAQPVTNCSFWDTLL